MQFILIPLLSYTILIAILFLITIHNQKRLPTKHITNPVSILIPFRNEEHNLFNLLSSLNKLNYDGEFEILLINDGSTDTSISIIENHPDHKNLNIRIIESIYDKSTPLTSKQQALDLGIHNAQFDWIALTDADMDFETDWLTTMMNASTENTALVFGHTSINSGKTILEKLQSYQLDFLFAVAYSFHLTGIAGSCMGNNLLISRSAYLQTGGHDTIGYSIVEDRALLNHFQKHHLKISCANPFTPKAFTNPVPTWHQFNEQIKRWAKGGLNWNSNLLPIGLLFSIQNAIFLTACTGFLNNQLTLIASGNLIFTWIYISVTLKFLGTNQKWWKFLPFYIFLQIETVLFLASLVSKNKIIWKGRSV
jgi:glycosyltransferase involved in cell wall biosynthesis